jgi:hypothetical protein
VIVWGAFEETPPEAQDATQLFFDRMELLQASETAVSPHRAPTDVPALDLQCSPIVFFRIRLTERSGRCENR